MSREYRQITEEKYAAETERLVQDAPRYMREFYDYMKNGRRVPSTQNRYIKDVLAFIRYEHDALPDCKDLDFAQTPAQIFDQLTTKDLIEYRSYLHQAKSLSNSTIKKKIASISAFYRFLNTDGYTKNNPLLNLELPKVNKKKIVKLDSEMSNRLLTGILKNDMYLAIPDYIQEQMRIEEKEPNPSTLEGLKQPLPIPGSVRARKEKYVLRNYAITALFLGSGLRVSELVGLDLTDISFRNNSLSIIKKGGDDTEVYFNDDVAMALRAYIDGTSLPVDMVAKYFTQNEGLKAWCQKHLHDPDIMGSLSRDFPDEDEEFYSEALLLSGALHRTGRLALINPKHNEKAVFLSNRGTRMTVRMVELMIKEMVRTYLPEYEDKNIFTPHKLRATCATRILTQTGDIQLAATQLNHKSISVTSQFYAELQKEKQKDQIKCLDMSSW